MSCIIESVPNVSEGRRHEVVDRIASAILGVAGVRLLDVSADPAHNRSVYTFIGAPAAVREAALALYTAALANIDMRRHRGVHPRIGAVDVLPLVPLSGATMEDCVDLALELGRLVAERFGLPVYFYEEAAVRPERRRLEAIRRGGFEGLGVRMADPAWSPDCGPPTPHESAGATVIGARRVLIAFNVNLTTDRLEVARRIARVVRESSGGLPHVKAIGVALAERGLVQVSMNLTNPAVTPLHEVFDVIAREAARENVEIAGSEVIGLAPLDAIVATARARLRLDDFTAGRVIEAHLPPPGGPEARTGPDT